MANTARRAVGIGAVGSKGAKASKAVGIDSKLKSAQKTAAMLGMVLLVIIGVLAMVLPELLKLLKNGQKAMAELKNNEEAMKVGLNEMSRKAEAKAEAEIDRRVANSLKKAQQGKNGHIHAES
jgi:hypothetical protein